MSVHVAGCRCHLRRLLPRGESGTAGWASIGSAGFTTTILRLSSDSRHFAFTMSFQYPTTLICTFRKSTPVSHSPDLSVLEPALSALIPPGGALHLTMPRPRAAKERPKYQIAHDLTMSQSRPANAQRRLQWHKPSVVHQTAPWQKSLALACVPHSVDSTAARY